MRKLIWKIKGQNKEQEKKDGEEYIIKMQKIYGDNVESVVKTEKEFIINLRK
jgi:hypothetical protein